MQNQITQLKCTVQLSPLSNFTIYLFFLKQAEPLAVTSNLYSLFYKSTLLQHGYILHVLIVHQDCFLAPQWQRQEFTE